jgi:hypothetical protein
MGRPNQPRGPSMPVYNKAGEVMFDLNDPSQCREAGNMMEKKDRIPIFVAEIERELICHQNGHHGCCWVAPPSHPEHGRHFQLDNNLRWGMAKLLVCTYQTPSSNCDKTMLTSEREQANNTDMNLKDLKTHLPDAFMTVVRQHNDDLPAMPSRRTGKTNVNLTQPSIQIHNHIPGSGPGYGDSHFSQGLGSAPHPTPPAAQPSSGTQASNTTLAPVPSKPEATLEFPSARYPRIGIFLQKLEAADVDRDYSCYEPAFVDCLGASSISDLLRTIREAAMETGGSKATGSTLLRVLREELKERKDLGNIRTPPLAIATVICQGLESAALECENSLRGLGAGPFNNFYD